MLEKHPKNNQQIELLIRKHIHGKINLFYFV